MQMERGSHTLVAIPSEGTLWALGGGQPNLQLDSVEVGGGPGLHIFLANACLYCPTFFNVPCTASAAFRISKTLN